MASWLSRHLLLGLQKILLVGMMIPSQMAEAGDDLDALLRETDQALGRSSVGDSPQVRPKAAERKKKSRPKEQNSQPRSGADGAGNAISSKQDDPTKSLLAPADAETVRELTTIGSRREAMLRPNEREQRVRVSGAVARLRGTYRLAKEDDFFESRSGETMPGMSVSYGMDLGDGFSVGVLGRCCSIAALGLSFFAGRVPVERSGVEYGEHTVSYRLIPASFRVGVRNEARSNWRIGLAYGPSADVLLQTGEGDTDSTSDFFFSDGVEASLETTWNRQWWVGLLLQARGAIRHQGIDVLALTLTTPASG